MQIRGKRLGRWVHCGVIALGGLTLAAAERAAAASLYDQLNITSKIENHYEYSIGSGPILAFDPTGDVHLRIGSNEGGFVSELGLDLTSKLDGDSFTYLHNGYCVGTCGVLINTNITFDITNISDTAVNIRWDSLITPGHLAQSGLGGKAEFNFFVLQAQSPDQAADQLYTAQGFTGGWYDAIYSSNGDFNGLFHIEDSTGVGHANAMTVSDWSATNLNLDLLEIAPHATTQLLYISQIKVGQTLDCTDLAACTGVQVAFGDPRNGGGGSTLTSDLGRGSLSLDAASDLEPLIGRAYDPYTVPLKFVDSDTPLPDKPPVIPPVTYGAPFVSQVVPEPASWAMMIAGFALAGAGLRRRSSPAPRFG